MESGSAAGDPSAHKNHKAHEIEDIIRKLPEPLIGHVLSYLPTKDAVRTSVLSKRWINHWTLINKLDLDDSLFCSPKKKAGGKQRFISFVYRTLLLIKCSSLESFSLVLAKNYDLSLLNTWISNILNRKVKNLCCIFPKYNIPFSALTCEALFDSVLLEELELEMWCCTIKIPSIEVRFQCLKLLKLYGVSFIYGSPTCFLKLDLPVLQKFETRNCTWLDVKGVVIVAPLLESVYIQQDCMSVSYGPRSCKILFFALHLKKNFTYCGYGMSQSIFLGDPSSAHRASANILLHQCGKKDPETRSSVFLLLKQFSQAKFIKFDGSEVLTQLRGSVLPVFAMLSHLELGQVSAEVLLGLLQKSPVLKTLIFKGISILDKELLDSAVVPCCFASNLEVVKFEKVNGSEHELCLAKFFMENGMVLERISFSLVSSRLAKSKVMEEFKEKLYSFKNGFSSAIVEFSIYKEVMRPAYNFSDFLAKT